MRTLTIAGPSQPSEQISPLRPVRWDDPRSATRPAHIAGLATLGPAPLSLLFAVLMKDPAIGPSRSVTHPTVRPPVDSILVRADGTTVKTCKSRFYVPSAPPPSIYARYAQAIRVGVGTVNERHPRRSRRATSPTLTSRMPELARGDFLYFLKGRRCAPPPAVPLPAARLSLRASPSGPAAAARPADTDAPARGGWRATGRVVVSPDGVAASSEAVKCTAVR
jgi:hypothetical protein